MILKKAKKIPKNVKSPKQLTLDKLPNVPIKTSVETGGSFQKKQIVITGIDPMTREDEFVLKVGFRLIPSKTAFSKIKSDFFFNKHKLKSVSITIPQGRLAADDFELTPVLDMKGISAGSYTIKVEMYELWSSGEKLSFASKKVTVDYVPQTRESKLIRIPIIKRFEGEDLAVVSESNKSIYRKMEETMKKESISKRDEW